MGPAGQSGRGFPLRTLATPRHSVARFMLSHAHDTPTLLKLKALGWTEGISGD